ncbi:MAG: IPTL-CTERM sorting domain-containing protein [Comamonadaceae bacterium]|nr:IPTL-CTERM sorting domain-containing protein [Comamonadaceae bacterium]
MPSAENSEPTGQRPMHWHWGAALALLGVAGAVQAQTPPLTIDETFRNATAPDWSLLGPVSGGASDPAVLTAASGGPDAPGEGWLRLTKAAQAQAGTALYKQAFSSSKGVDVSFQYATWGTNSGRGGDGFTFYLIDGAEADPVVGARGGSLGYSWGNYGAGVKSGYVGIGFDEYGNFSHPTFGVCEVGANVTECARQQHRVAVRGSGHLLGFAPGDAQNKTTGFKLLHNKMPTMPPPDTTIFTGNRDGAKNVRIVITPAPEVKLTVILEGQTIVDQLPLTQANGAPVDGMAALPSTFKMGFSSSTGGAINHHEIRNLTVRQAQLEAMPDSYSTPHGQALDVAAAAPNALGANDLGILPGAAYALQGQATGGTAAVNADGSFRFEPAADFAGEASFTYQVCNQPASNPANCKTAVATVIVGPNAQPDEATTTVGQPATGNLKANDTVPASASYKLKTAPNAAQGTVDVQPDGTYTFTPAAGFSGDASFSYEVCSGPNHTAPCAEAAVTVKVNPKAEPDSYSTVQNTELPADAARNLGANDAKPGNAKFSLVTPPVAAQGTATVHPDGTFSFKPAQDFVGDATFSYKVCNEAGTHCSAETSVTVKVQLQEPSPQDDTFTTTVGQPVNGDLKANDTAPATASYGLVGGSATGGTATVNTNGTFSFEPAAGFSGDASFSYEVCVPVGNSALCREAKVTIKVNPKADPDSYSTAPNTELPADAARNLGANDAKPNNAKFSLVPGSATNGAATVHPNGTFSFKPAQDFVGDANFSYKVCNEAGTHCSDPVSVTIKVASAPVAKPDEFTVAPGQPIQGDVKGNDVVPAGAVFSLVPGTPSPDPATQGTLVFNNDGTFTFTPVQGFTGAVAFEYQMCAGPGGSAPCVRATVRLNVQAIVSPSAVPVPALNLWSLLGLSALLGVFGLRRRQRQ